MNLYRIAKPSLALAATLACLLASPPLHAAAPAARPPEASLLAVLSSGAAPGEKAIACKQLAICGTDKAVPALAALLPDKDLSSWARIALEAIPGSAASKALRDALPKVQGRLLIGVMNSLAVRRDAKAVSPLAAHLGDADPAVAAAAAEALGRIGGSKATRALSRTLAKGPGSLRAAAALGCVLSADQYLAAGKNSSARKVYDQVRAADVPRQRTLEALRGSILARGNDGIPMLLDLLHSPQKDLFALGLSTARELPGRQATAALAAEISRPDNNRSPLLLLALADRNDPSAMPAIFNAAKSGPASLRLAALPLLERVGGLSSIPVLLAATTESDTEIAPVARAALVSLQDNAADATLLQRLAKSAGRERQVLIQVANQRHLDAALPEILASLKDNDPAVRQAAVQALGALGGASQISDLIALAEKSDSPAATEAAAAALQAIAGRSGAAAVPALCKLAGSSRTELRIVSLHALASAGGQDALDAINKLAGDSDAAVQDEAIRTLAAWPNTWPEDTNILAPLLALGRNAPKPTHQVLASRAFLDFLRTDKKLKPEDRLERLKEILPAIQRPEEKRVAISLAAASSGAATLPILSQFATDTTVADDACAALLAAASKETPGVSKEDRRKALQLILDNSASDDLKKKAQERLKDI